MVVIPDSNLNVFRVLYRPSFVIDGNFKLQHLAMRRPDDDVFLRDGQGHMVGQEPYWMHLTNTVEWLEVGDMFNHMGPDTNIFTAFRSPVVAIIEL
jgi:hypothetical protein